MSDLDTLLAHLVAAGVKRAYRIGDVPSSPPGAYCVLSLDAGTPKVKRLAGGSTVATRSLSVQIFGESYDAVADLTGRADVAFKDAHLPLAGSPLSERVLSIGPTRDPDGEVLLYVLHTYQYQESR